MTAGPRVVAVQSFGWTYCTPAAVLPSVSAAAGAWASAGRGRLARARAISNFIARLLDRSGLNLVVCDMRLRGEGQAPVPVPAMEAELRSEEHTSELQSLMP